MALQFGTSIVAGCAFIWWYRLDPEWTNAQGATLGGFLVGLIAARAVMFAITWARFGWYAARGMQLGG
jgi:hypothetical protein